MILCEKKVRPLFCHFLANLQKIRPRIFSAAEIFVGPLLRFAAEISAGWQHCVEAIREAGYPMDGFPFLDANACTIIFSYSR
jgi:hypothetical protein